jgi:hypothetical protein
MVALYAGAAVLLGACGPTGTTEPSKSGPSEVRAVHQRVVSAEEAGSGPIVSPESSVSSSEPFQSQTNPAVAVGNGLSLVVWSELVGPGNADVYGVRVSTSDGAVLDATPLRIATGSPSQYQPAVAFDGTNFLVVWNDTRKGAPQVYGTRVRASDGAVLDVPSHFSPGYFGGPPQFNPSVAFDGTYFLVTFEGYNRTSNAEGYMIQGVHVRPSDGLRTSYPFFIGGTGFKDFGYHHRSKVACGGGRCFVAWRTYYQEGGDQGFDIRGMRVGAGTGSTLDPQPLRFTNTSGVDELYPSVASDGKDFLVTWRTGSSDSLFGARVRGSDGALLDSSALSVAASHLGDANVTFDGVDYVVAFQGMREGTRQLLAQWVTPGGVVVPERALATLHPSSTQEQVGLAATGTGHFLAAYTQYDQELALNRIRLRQVEALPLGVACSDGDPCGSGFCVDGVCCESACGGGAGTDCQACSVAAGGSVDGVCGTVRAEAAVACRPSAVACDVAEVCDGTSTSCPADEPSVSEPELSGDKCEDTPCDVASFLAALGSESLEPSIVSGLQAKAEAACRSFQAGNTHAMQGQLWALSSQLRAQSGNGIPADLANTLLASLSSMFRSGTCVPVEWPMAVEPALLPTDSADQSRLVSPEISVPTSSSVYFEKEVVSASAGDISLVVWVQDYRAGSWDQKGNQNIVAMRVRKSDGALLGTTPLCIACSGNSEVEPGVASNGQDFLVTWTEDGDYIDPTIRGIRVRASDGQVLGPPMQISSTSRDHRKSSVASDGNDYLVTWQSPWFRCFFPPGPPRPNCFFHRAIDGARVSAAGVPGLPFHVSSADNFPSWNQGPSVAYAGGNYLITWSGDLDPNSTTQRLYSARVRASDSLVLDTPSRLLGPIGSSSVVATDGSQFLVGWSTPSGEIRASRMGLDGTMLDPEGFLVGAGSQANLLFDGTDYRVVRLQGQELKGVRVTREGLVVGDSESVLAQGVPPATLVDGRPALDLLGPGRFLVGYSRKFEATSQKTQVKLRVVEELPLGSACTQDAQCESGSCVDGVCCESACGGGVTNDCQACSVAAGGTADGTCAPVRADAAVVCRSSVVACDAAEVCDGTSFSCPADDPGASQPDLTCDKCQDSPCDVANYLAALGPELLLQSTGHSLQLKADAACRSYEAGKTTATEGHLRALLNEVRSQGTTLPATVADTLSASLTDMLGL